MTGTDTRPARAVIEALTAVRASIQAIDGTIHPTVAMATLAFMARIFSHQPTRASVKTKAAIVALIDAMREEANDDG